MKESCSCGFEGLRQSEEGEGTGREMLGVKDNTLG